MIFAKPYRNGRISVVLLLYAIQDRFMFFYLLSELVDRRIIIFDDFTNF